MPTLEEIKLALIAVAILGACALTGHFVHQVDLAKLEKVELQYKQAEADAQAAAKAEQAQLDKAAHDADAAELAQQKAMLADAQTRLSQVSKHVATGRAACITWGMIREIDASLLGVDSDTLPMPAAKTDASCASRDAIDFITSIVGNFEIAQRNVEHGQALQKYLQQLSQVKR